MKRRLALPYGPYGSGRTLRFFTIAVAHLSYLVSRRFAWTFTYLSFLFIVVGCGLLGPVQSPYSVE